MMNGDEAGSLRAVKDDFSWCVFVGVNEGYFPSQTCKEHMFK